jgi:hypothetical protein
MFLRYLGVEADEIPVRTTHPKRLRSVVERAAERSDSVSAVPSRKTG